MLWLCALWAQFRVWKQTEINVGQSRLNQERERNFSQLQSIVIYRLSYGSTCVLGQAIIMLQVWANSSAP